MTTEEKIQWLMNILIFHKKLYYSGEVRISDRNYDAYEDDLRRIDPKNPVLDLVGYSDDYEQYVTKGKWFSEQIPYYKKGSK